MPYPVLPILQCRLQCHDAFKAQWESNTTGAAPEHRRRQSEENVKARPSGFSLLELMIVVAISGVLLAVAIPSYQEYVLRGKQGAARAVLLNIAQKQPQFLADRRSTYAPCLSATYLYGGLTAAACATEHLSLYVPEDVSALYGFTITLSSPPPGYVAVATPLTSAVGTTVFKIDQAGKRTKVVDGVEMPW
jgi:type IV pilus assembly protein PilE